MDTILWLVQETFRQLHKNGGSFFNGKFNGNLTSSMLFTVDMRWMQVYLILALRHIDWKD